MVASDLRRLGRAAAVTSSGAFGQLAGIVRVTISDSVPVGEGIQQLEGVVAHGLQHREAQLAVGPALPDQAVIDQRRQCVEDVGVVADDVLDGFQRRPAAEHRQITKQPPVLGRYR